MDIDKATSYVKNPLDAANQAMIYSMIVGDLPYKSTQGIPYKDSTELWDLSVTISGGVVPLSYVIQKIRNIANEFKYTCDVEVLMNLIVFKKVKLNICGESTKKYALKLKSKLEDYIHQF